MYPSTLIALALSGSAVAAPPPATPAVAAVTYHVKPDLRDCAWPMCGGYFVRALNRSTTKCANGTRERWCYVAELDWDTAGWDPADVTDFLTTGVGGHVAIHGEQELVPLGPGPADYGVLVPRVAFSEYLPRPKGTMPPRPAVVSQAYDVRPDMRLCPSVACGGWWIRALNRSGTLCADGSTAASCYVAEIDWDAAGWDPKDVQDFQVGAQGGYVMLIGPQELRPFGGQGDFGVLVPRLGLREWQR